MAKLQTMFTQAKRGQTVGFLGKTKTESKAHAAALVVHLPKIVAGYAEAVQKAGADGLLFTWDGKNSSTLETLKSEIESAHANNEDLVSGLHITGHWDQIDNESLTKIKESGIQYIILPLDAPARLLSLEAKDIEKVVTVPMRSGDMYPLFIRNLATLEGISAVLLDFNLKENIGSLTIENILHYQAIREAVRFPAFINVPGDLSEADAYTLKTLGVQAVVLTASSDQEETQEHIKAIHTILEKISQEENEANATKRRP
jgi:hypothetical protein